jgi:hypothetical protein
MTERHLALNPPPDPAQAIPADWFSENRIGLDHLRSALDMTQQRNLS